MLRASSSTVALSLCAVLAASIPTPTAGSGPQQENRGGTGYARLIAPSSTIAEAVPFDVAGHVSTRRVKRTVHLEGKVPGGTWSRMGTTTTDRRGKFLVEDLRLDSSTRLRGVLPAHTTRVPAVAGARRVTSC